MKDGTRKNYTRTGKKGKCYLRISAGPQRGIYVHQLVAMALVRRPLTQNEVPDHIDGDGQNNHPSNIRVMSITNNSRLKRGYPPQFIECIFDGSMHWNLQK